MCVTQVSQRRQRKKTHLALLGLQDIGKMRQDASRERNVRAVNLDAVRLDEAAKHRQQGVSGQLGP